MLILKEHTKVLRTISSQRKKYDSLDDNNNCNESSEEKNDFKKKNNDSKCKSINSSNKMNNFNSNLNNTVTNNIININLYDKIPKVTCVLNINNSPNINPSLTPNNSSKYSSTNYNSLKNTDSRQNIKRDTSFSKTVKSRKQTLIDKVPDFNYGTKHLGFKSPVLNAKKGIVINKNVTNINLNNEIEVKNKANNSIINGSSKYFANIDFNNYKNYNNNYNTNTLTDHLKLEDDSISISAVTYNNEGNLNASELEIMENVLYLDGVNNLNYNNNYLMNTVNSQNNLNTVKNNKISKLALSKNSSNNSSKKKINKSPFNTSNYTQQYLNKLKSPNSTSAIKKLEESFLDFDDDKKYKEEDVFTKALNGVRDKSEKDLKKFGSFMDPLN